MKIMIYSRHVLGIGHFFRSMEIAAALSRHEVIFVEGGDPLEGFTPPPHVVRLFLPPVMMDSEFKTVVSRGVGPHSMEADRERLLLEHFRRRAPDVLITELFPFGRKRFAGELLPVLETIKEKRLSTKVVCSLRDILVEKRNTAAYESGVVETLNEFYDLLLIHSDPNVVSLSETFERIEDIKVPVRYTGFVSRSAPGIRKKASSRKTIVVSGGGGKVGVELPLSAVSAFCALPDPAVRLKVFIGPFMDEADRTRVRISANGDGRISVHPFSLDFIGELARADLSISMAGYNTCMDVLSAGVRAIVCPFLQNREQLTRARRFESMGLLRVIETPDPALLRRMIPKALESPAPPAAGALLDMNGAANTALMVEKCFNGH